MPALPRPSAIRTVFAGLVLASLLCGCATSDTADRGLAGALPDALPSACRTQCVTPYGARLGSAPGGVPAYSNCNAGCTAREPNRENGTYTGLKWQCVEFARRWLLNEKNAVFEDVDTAADLWNLQSVRQIDGQRLELLTFLNGAWRAPEVGDLLIYAKEYLGTGHVAVVTVVNLKAGYLAVAEQNFLNQRWPGDYARRLDVIHKNNRYWVLDPYLLGWKRM